MHMEHKPMIKIIALLWMWWKTRDKINAGEGVLKIDEVVAMVDRRALSVKNIASSQRRPHELSCRDGNRWPPPC